MLLRLVYFGIIISLPPIDIGVTVAELFVELCGVLVLDTPRLGLYLPTGLDPRLVGGLCYSPKS